MSLSNVPERASTLSSGLTQTILLLMTGAAIGLMWREVLATAATLIRMISSLG